MKLACLFSGGKDSNYALYLADKFHEISCLISLISKNQDSYMFQTPGLDKIDSQAQALGIPILKQQTKGEKEEELKDLKKALLKAKIRYGIEGLVTGAIKSKYQASRIQKICYELDIECFNPLWQKDEVDFLYQLLDNKFKIMIIGIASYPLTNTYLGKIIDKELVEKFISYKEKFGFNPAGEGGEIETFVLDSPLFKSKLEVINFEKVESGENSGRIKNLEVKNV